MQILSNSFYVRCDTCQIFGCKQNGQNYIHEEINIRFIWRNICHDYSKTLCRFDIKNVKSDNNFSSDYV